MKKLLLPLWSILLLTACQKQITRENEQKVSEDKNSLAAKSPTGKIDVCHYDVATASWHSININLNAWPEHQAHGDVRLDDPDSDGYVPNNAVAMVHKVIAMIIMQLSTPEPLKYAAITLTKTAME